MKSYEGYTLGAEEMRLWADQIDAGSRRPLRYYDTHDRDQCIVAACQTFTGSPLVARVLWCAMGALGAANVVLLWLAT